jgi:protein-disulfide isomerase-like protein with CxxC motif
VHRVRVLHFTDPGCPWAYCARPAHARLRWRFGDQLSWRLVLIGLTESAQQYVERGYTPEGAALGQRVFRERFGMPFATQPKPRMAATSPGCRAIVAARETAPELAEAALRALQLMQFTTTGLLDDPTDLRRALETVPGLDAEAIVSRLDDPDVVDAYEQDRSLARAAEGSPTEAQGRSASSDGPVRYTAPSLVFEHEDGSRLEAGGFQPFEAYDALLANLDPTLERRPLPASAMEALTAFPEGLTTAEVAGLVRPSDLVDADRGAAEEELLSLAGRGEVEREPAGQDAVWRVAAR